MKDVKWNYVIVHVCVNRELAAEFEGVKLDLTILVAQAAASRDGSRGSQISRATNVKKACKKIWTKVFEFFPAQTLLFISDHAIKTLSHSSI